MKGEECFWDDYDWVAAIFIFLGTKNFNSTAKIKISEILLLKKFEENDEDFYYYCLNINPDKTKTEN